MILSCYLRCIPFFSNPHCLCSWTVSLSYHLHSFTGNEVCEWRLQVVHIKFKFKAHTARKSPAETMHRLWIPSSFFSKELAVLYHADGCIIQHTAVATADWDFQTDGDKALDCMHCNSGVKGSTDSLGSYGSSGTCRISDVQCVFM